MSEQVAEQWRKYLHPSRMRRIEEKLNEGMAKEFASQFSSSDVCNQDVLYLLATVKALEAENEQLQARVFGKAEE